MLDIVDMMYYSNNSIASGCLHNAHLNVNSCIGAEFAFPNRIDVTIFKFKSLASIHRILQVRFLTE